MDTIRRPSFGGLLMLALLAAATPASAQSVGSVVSVTGQVEIGRGGESIQAIVGTPIQENDEVRTGQPGRARIVLRDDSVITLADNSQLTIDRQVFDQEQGEAETWLGLLQGKINSVVSDHYRNPGTGFEVRTRNATAGVRGTEFIVAYDADTDLTEVVGISGEVSVHGAFDPAASAVLVTAREISSVAGEGKPSNTEELDEKTFKQYLNEIDFISASLSGGNSLADGSSVPQPDRAPLAAGGGAEENPEVGLTLGPDASGVLGQSPAAVKSSTGTLGIDLGNKP